MKSRYERVSTWNKNIFNLILVTACLLTCCKLKDIYTCAEVKFLKQNSLAKICMKCVLLNWNLCRTGKARTKVYFHNC